MHVSFNAHSSVRQTVSPDICLSGHLPVLLLPTIYPLSTPSSVHHPSTCLSIHLSIHHLSVCPPISLLSHSVFHPASSLYPFICLSAPLSVSVHHLSIHPSSICLCTHHLSIIYPSACLTRFDLDSMELMRLSLSGCFFVSVLGLEFHRAGSWEGSRMNSGGE